MIHWILHYHPEVVSYLIDLRESGSELRQFIRSFENGPPPVEEAVVLQDWPHTYDFFEEGHWIRYMVLDEEKIIRILLVEPGSEEVDNEGTD